MTEGLGVPKPQKIVEYSKSEHLIKGVNPIMICVGSYDDFNFTDFIKQKIPNKEYYVGDFKYADDVNYYDDVSTNREKNYLVGGRKTWTISTVDTSNKFSERFIDCTALVVTGVHRITGKNISFLSHQDPTQFLRTIKNKFASQLSTRLTEIKNLCRRGTIDAVILGGKYPPDFEDDFTHKRDRMRQNYIDSIELLSSEVKKVLGFEPNVFNGPKFEDDSENENGICFDSVYYDTLNKRLYFMRPKVNPGIGTFTQSDIEEERRK